MSNIIKEEILIIEDHLFEDVISVVFTNDINESIKHNAELNNFVPEKYLVTNANAVTLDIDEGKFHSSAIIFDINKTKITDIVHETNHLTYNILSVRDMLLNNETMEIYAYFQAWIFKKIHAFWEEIK